MRGPAMADITVVVACIPSDLLRDIHGVLSGC